MVGAPSPDAPGLYYQWGAVNGHTFGDGFAFTEASYIELGLDSIFSDLSENQDAARNYYGPNAKMPRNDQYIELAANCSISTISPSFHKFTSLINGNSIIVCYTGYINDSNRVDSNRLRVWSSKIRDQNFAFSWHGSADISAGRRYYGLNIMAVHS